MEEGVGGVDAGKAVEGGVAGEGGDDLNADVGEGGI